MASNLIYNTPKHYQGQQSLQSSPRSATADRSHSTTAHTNNLYLTATSFNANNLIHNVAVMDMYDTAYNKSMKVTDQRYMYKKAENEAQILYNRIRLLSQEESKALKKISETQKRASEILSYRERNIKTSQERKRRKDEYDLQINEKHIQVQQVKDISKIAKQLINESIQHKVKSEAQQLKQSKMKYREYINRVSDDLYQQKLTKTNYVKSQEKDAEYRKEKIQELKVQRAKGNYSKKLHQEIQKKEMKEIEVHELEKSEMKMVQNLKNTQNLQAKALKDFEDILIQSRNTSPAQQLNLNKSLMQYYSPSSPNRSTATKGIRKHHYHLLNNSVLVERLHQQSPSEQRGNSQNGQHLNLQINAFSYNPQNDTSTPSNRRVIDALKGSEKQNTSRRSSIQNSPALHDISTEGSKVY